MTTGERTRKANSGKLIVNMCNFQDKLGIVEGMGI